MAKRKKSKKPEVEQPTLPVVEDEPENKPIVDEGPRNVRVIEASFDVLDGHKTDAVAIFIGPDERPLRGINAMIDWRLCGRLSRLILSGAFKGDRGERVLFATSGRLRAEKIFIFGLGAGAKFSDVLGEAARVMKKAEVHDGTLALPDGVELDPSGCPAPLTSIWT